MLPTVDSTNTYGDSEIADFALTLQSSSPPTIFTSVLACSAELEGQQALISDSNTATWGATITGGGSNHVLGYCDGTNWTVAAN
jgi:hypothetical protein